MEQEKPIIPQIGMQKDIDDIRTDSQQYSHALNACVESHNGNIFSLQNEPSNNLSIDLVDREVVGYIYILSLNKTLLFTTDSKGTDSIEYFEHIHKDVFEDCDNINKINVKPENQLTNILSTNFNWNVHNRLNIQYKITDCYLNLYFSDGNNPDRFLYLDLNDLSLHEDFKTNGNIDINKTLFNQNILYPKIELSLQEGDSLEEGVYQFFTCYSTSKGIPLSSYNESKIIPVFEKVYKKDNDKYIANKSIKLEITGFKDNYYKYVNIIVGKTINNQTTFYNVVTLPISNIVSYNYSDNPDYIIKTINDISFFKPYYRNSKFLSVSNNYLFRAGVDEFSKINIQRIANKLQLECVTKKVKEDYYKYNNDKSYLRDEVYAFGIELVLTEGEFTGVGHIPSRKSNLFDIQNDWKNNNTAYLTSSPNTNEVWQTFDFAYWESTEKYPDNIEIYGELANTNIRHHKFPDCSIAHIHDNENTDINGLYSKDVNLFILGIRIKNENNFKNILDQCVDEKIITQEQRNRIVGYRLVRLDRRGEKSIVAKGLIHNMWSYKKPSVYNEKDNCSLDTEYYYPSIGFNDLRDDPFLSKNSKHYKYKEFEKGTQNPELLNYVDNNKYTFYSPNTSYVQPTIGNNLRLETEEYGESLGYFNVCEDQAQYKILNSNQYNLATLLARFIANNTVHESDNGASTGSAIGSTLGSAIPGVGTVIGGIAGGLIGSLLGGDDDVTSSLQRNSTILFQTEKFLQIFKNLADFRKLQYQYQAIGKYKGYKKLGLLADRNRKIINSSYLNTNKISINNTFINNSFRESSVYLELDSNIKRCSIEDKSKVKINNDKTIVVTACKKYKVEIQEGAFETRSIPFTIPPTSIRIPTTISFQNCKGEAERWVIGKPETRYLTAIIPPTETAYIKVTEELNCPECSQFKVITKTECSCIDDTIISPISAYYASIKNDNNNQYGSIFNSNYISISEITTLDKPLNVVFEGDTFITPHIFKKKHSYFNNTTFGLPNETDIFYQDLANVAYPVYYFNTKPTEREFKPNTSLLYQLSQFGNVASSTFSFWDSLFGGGSFSIASSILSDFSFYALDPLVWLKAPNFYLDCYDNNNKSKPLGLFSFEPVKGVSYLYNYAIPYFYCESDINTYYRISKNNKEYDFYPNQEDLNYWLQEKNVSINNDNFYFYDRTYSKQNLNNFHYVNDINFKPYDECKYKHNNRTIYSLQSSELDNSDLIDNYLINKPLDYYDFNLVDGKLTGIYSIESEKVLVTFENNLQIFSAFNTLQSEQGNIQIGNGGIFKSKPQEFSKSKLGYLGSNHLITSTEFGHVIIDSIRGQVFLLGLNGNGITEISKDKMRNWFKTYLPFQIYKYFNIESHQQIGINVGYDKRFNRILITKLDYSPKKEDIKYIDNKFYYNNIEVFLDDTKYFNNHSFTISYNFSLNSWTSFHSYKPLYYINYNNTFLSGIKHSIWNHNNLANYQTFYNELHPFEIELMTGYSNNQVLQSFSYYLDCLKYFSEESFISLNHGFNKSYIYNNKQNTGLLELIPSSNNLFYDKQYPKVFLDKTQILQSVKENKFSFNQFKNRYLKGEMFKYSKNGVDKKILYSSLAENKSIKFDSIRNNINFIRLIQDKYNQYKFIFKFSNINKNNSWR